METKAELSQETQEAVQDLIQANLDSESGFREVAGEVDDPQLSQLFVRMAETRKELARDLQAHVLMDGERPRLDGSWLASLHRTWVDIRAKVSGGDPAVLLTEAERGEDYIKAAYEDVLKRTAGSALNDLLQHQYAEIKKGHDSIRELRDTFRK